MGTKSLDLKKFQLSSVQSHIAEPISVAKISNYDIAIIGMAARLPHVANIDEFWEKIRQGFDFVGPFPEQRKQDLDSYFDFKRMNAKESQHNEGAYLDRIDDFDPTFFNIPPKEASLMDPNQRIFLETVWHAIEDAGYSGKKIRGTKTGVFVGHSNDRQLDYKFMAWEVEPEYANISIPGNIKSIIASRISYLLDLKGPTMLVDTACSSGLTALHLACSEIQNNRCEMALVGGIKLILTPANHDGQDIGIFSSTHRARTFDDSSDGTGLGEGAIVFLLKPLFKAIEDHDNIHAVIKGTAINQDGASNGITSPNSLAQADVIESAWKAARVEPETITYIEAHGTGTVLGDPIEIDGMTKAFRKYTDKKQFCGVSSIKTNLGHLDNAAALAGVLKAVLSLKHRELPPTVHFQRSNRKINFLDSPVYVVNKLQKWVSHGPLRCGISSFGLSGTNSHAVLEEAPDQRAQMDHIPAASLRLLVLSAQKKETLHRLVKGYVEFILDREAINWDDVCYTASTGRGHYPHRLAILFANRTELLTRLHEFQYAPEEEQEGIFYGYHELIPEKKQSRSVGDLTSQEKQEITQLANQKVRGLITEATDRLVILNELSQLYIRGAEVDWEGLYANQVREKITLPVYPFERKRCWLDFQKINNYHDEVKYGKNINHPLLDFCLAESFNQDVYQTHFEVGRHWVLAEHQVEGRYVVPGTTYLQIARELARKYYGDSPIELKRVFFLYPLIVEEGERRETQTLITKAHDHLEFVVMSKPELQDTWLKHAEGMIYTIPKAESLQVSLAELKQAVGAEVVVDYSQSHQGAVVTGPRWKNLKTIAHGSEQLLVKLGLAEEYAQDLEEYDLHPALLDMAVNVVSQSIGQGLYLPFSYGRFELYQNLPMEFYSHLRRKDKANQHLETISFDIQLINPEGEVFGRITDYTIKKVHQPEMKLSQSGNQLDVFHEIHWVVKDLSTVEALPVDSRVLIFKDRQEIATEVGRLLRESGCEVIEVEFGSEYRMISPNQYRIRETEADYIRLFEEVKETNLSQIIYMATITGQRVCAIEELDLLQERGVYSLFHITKALLQNKYSSGLRISLISNCVNEVTGQEPMIHPYAATLFGLGKVVAREYDKFHCHCIDIDDETTPAMLIRELGCHQPTYQVAYRQGTRYVEEFKRVEIEKIPIRDVSFREDGVYLITGGTGGIGLEMARYLAAQGNVNLALIHRSPLPASENWVEIIQTSGDAKLVRKLKVLQELKESGIELTCCRADVAKQDELEPVIDGLRERYGRINGIIHAAGVAGDGFLLKKERAVFHEVLAPKVWGTWLLDHLTEEDQPDFFIMFSSISSLLGDAGQGDYTSANSFLDAFAAYRQRWGRPTLTINWPAWKETGMAADYGVNKDGMIFKAITTQKAITAFETVLFRELNKVIISELNYEQIAVVLENFPVEISHELRLTIEKRRATPANSTVKKQTPVKIKGGSNPSTVIEKKVAEIWARVLGLEEIDLYASFYDSGGDSIMAAHLVKEMEKEMPGLIDVTDIFTYPSVHEIAGFMEKKQNEESPENLSVPMKKSEEELNEIFQQLARGEISLEEAEKYIK